MTGDIFREARERVTAQDAAQHYGIEIEKSGKARCPFHHPDRHPSMTFKHGRYRCWSCGASGNSIDLTAHLLGLDALGAVRELNRSFSLNLSIDRQQTPAERREAEQAARRRQEVSDIYELYQRWRNQTITRLNTAFRIAHMALKDHPENLSGSEALAVKWQPALEYWCDTLLYGNMDQQMEIFRDRKGVEQVCREILNNTQMKSGAA